MSDRTLAMMPWFPRDFIAATRAMRLAERGAYRELLDFQWEMGTLPKGHDELARLLGVSREEFDDIWPAIADKFKAKRGKLVNPRLEEHRNKALEIRAVKRASGSKGGLAKARARAKQDDSKPVAAEDSSAVAKLYPPSPSPSPSKIKKNPSLRSGEKESTGSPKARPATHLPNDFALTEQRRQYASEQGIDPDKTFENFCDYWRAASGARARKRDWDATWRMWCRREAASGGKPNGTGAKIGRRLTRYEELFGTEDDDNDEEHDGSQTQQSS